MNPEELESYLSGSLLGEERDHLEHLLAHDSELRARFIEQIQVDAALRALLGGDGNHGLVKGVMARLHSEVMSDRDFAKSVLLEIVEEREKRRSIPWRDIITACIVSAAASIGLLLLFQSIAFRGGQSHPHSPTSFVAHLERSENLVWNESCRSLVRADGWLTPGFLKLDSGSIAVTFNSGATVLIEGPSEFGIESGNRMFLKSGRLVAEVPDKAHGFTVNTPRINAVDLGTRFGLDVTADGTSDLHVMQGIVAASRTSGNTATTIVHEGLAVRADGRSRSPLQSLDYGGDTFRLRLGAQSSKSPALRFRFDESSGSLLQDTGTDRRFDIALVAPGGLDRSPRRSLGHSGGGLSFQPWESLEIPLSPQFRVEQPHTIALWLRLDVSDSGEKTPERILRFGDSSSQSWNLSVNHESNYGVLGALRIDWGRGILVGSTDCADGNWHHVAYRFLGGTDPSSRIHLFVDGRPEIISYSHAEDLPISEAKRLSLGRSQEEGFRGSIDDLVVFRIALPTPTLQKYSN